MTHPAAMHGGKSLRATAGRASARRLLILPVAFHWESSEDRTRASRYGFATWRLFATFFTPLTP